MDTGTGETLKEVRSFIKEVFLDDEGVRNWMRQHRRMIAVVGFGVLSVWGAFYFAGMSLDILERWSKTQPPTAVATTPTSTPPVDNTLMACRREISDLKHELMEVRSRVWLQDRYLTQCGVTVDPQDERNARCPAPPKPLVAHVPTPTHTRPRLPARPVHVKPNDAQHRTDRINELLR